MFNSRLLAILIILPFSACKKTDLGPIADTYIGYSETEEWGYEELIDDIGNFQGVRGTRDTIYSPQDTFMVKQVNKKNLFTISAGGELARINSFSSHEFSYDGQQEFSIVNYTNGIEDKRLEFTFTGTGEVSLQYHQNQLNDNRPPTGRKIIFSGSSQ